MTTGQIGAGPRHVLSLGHVDVTAVSYGQAALATVSGAGTVALVFAASTLRVQVAGEVVLEEGPVGHRAVPLTAGQTLRDLRALHSMTHQMKQKERFNERGVTY